MTRIKKRRSGKNKTADQQRSAAGRRRARTAATAPLTAEEKKADAIANAKSPAPKKKKPVPGGRRGARNEAGANSKKNIANEAKAVQPAGQPGKGAGPAKSPGKTRSAGARRVTVSRAVANTFKKPAAGNKKEAPAKDTASG